MDLGERIKEFMAYKHLTQSGLGEVVGFSDVAIGKYLLGKTKPKFEFWKGIAESYPDINIGWLLTGKGQMLIKESEMNVENAIRFLRDNKDEAVRHEGVKELLEMLDKRHYNKSIEDRLTALEQSNKK